jgi:steroid 5-alpha reductase family enzyme
MSRRGAIGVMVVAYAVVVLAGVLVLHRVDAPPLAAMFLADLLGTAIVFGFSRALDNSSMYDPYWSVAPILMGAWWWLEADLAGHGGLVMVALLVWGGRLTWNFLRGWSGLSHEDWRYVAIREKTGRAYWPVSLLGIHLFPTLLVFGGMLPAHVALSGQPTLPVLAVMGLLTCLSAALIQGIADNQLRAFRASSPPPGSILDAGLWRYSRHPNYFGEVLFWWGIALLGLSADPGAVWTLIGPVGITALFVFISVPMTDRKTLESRPHYAAHMARVSGLVPLPRR